MSLSVHPAEQTGQPLHDRWRAEAEALDVPGNCLNNMQVFLEEMRPHSEYTYEHSMRIGILTAEVGAFVPELEHLPGWVLFYAGTMHDRGKLETPQELLAKKTGWTDEDTSVLRAHPIHSYEALLQEGMPFIAGAVVLHHTFQPDPYPAETPEPDSRLPERLSRLQPVIARVIALADFYDASHREDAGHFLTKEEIRAKVYRENPDVIEFLDRLYAESVFT